MVRLVLLISTIVSFGCASMFSGTAQNFMVRSDIKGAKLFLNNEEIGTDTATVQIAKKNLKNSVLIAKKPGCSDATARINTKFDPVTLLGFLLDFGIISILVVDWGITGAVNEAERTDFLLNPSC